MSSKANTIRVLWLINHRMLRDFELKLLYQLDVDEIFIPKSPPYYESNKSLPSNEPHNKNLSIPEEDLSILNQQNWHDEPNHKAWEIANKYFQLVFFADNPTQIKSIVSNFHGKLIFRALGLKNGESYSHYFYQSLEIDIIEKIKTMGERFRFAPTHKSLISREQPFLRQKACYLPLGLADTSINSDWSEIQNKVLFSCPEIASNQEAKIIYREFVSDFKDIDYLIFGAQTIKHHDSRVLGFIEQADYDQLMKSNAVMFYNSTEPTLFHYHPFHAIKNSMPLIFMAGSILDELGGENLPGRANSINEAREKIKRILSNDLKFIQKIKESQPPLLTFMKIDHCKEQWAKPFKKILTSIPYKQKSHNQTAPIKKKVAILISGALNDDISTQEAKLIANTLASSPSEDSEIEVILAYSTGATNNSDDLHNKIQTREFKWELLNPEASKRCMTFSGHHLAIEQASFAVPNDGINYFMDCDLWIVIGGERQASILPLRPYITHYSSGHRLTNPYQKNSFSVSEHQKAKAVLCFSSACAAEVNQYAGVQKAKITNLGPISAPLPADLQTSRNNISPDKQPRTFICLSNAPKIERNPLFINALRIYYEILDGQFNCIFMSTTDNQGVQDSFIQHTDELSIKPEWLNRLLFLEASSELERMSLIKLSNFIWDIMPLGGSPATILKACSFNIPILCSSTPQMEEMAKQYQLNINFHKGNSAYKIATEIKAMESIQQNDTASNKLTTENITKYAEIFEEQLLRVIQKCL